MTGTFSTMINFSMLGLLRRLHELDILEELQSEETYRFFLGKKSMAGISMGLGVPKRKTRHKGMCKCKRKKGQSQEETHIEIENERKAGTEKTQETGNETMMTQETGNAATKGQSQDETQEIENAKTYAETEKAQETGNELKTQETRNETKYVTLGEIKNEEKYWKLLKNHYREHK